jgi:hypothetical protein
MIISSKPFLVHIVIVYAELEDVKYFNYLSSVITNDAECLRKLNPGLPWQMQHSGRSFPPADMA